MEIVKLHRKVKDSFLWEEKPFTKGQAYIDMLLQCEMKYNKETNIKKGSFITTQSELCKQWSWSRKKVSNFLNTLSEKRLIEVKKNTKKNTKKTTITMMYYDGYEIQTKPKEHKKEHKKEPIKLKLIFDEFRKEYPGTKRGLETEFKNFKKQHNDYSDIIPNLSKILTAQIKDRKDK